MRRRLRDGRRCGRRSRCCRRSGAVARMERSEIRASVAAGYSLPDCAALHPGYALPNHTRGKPRLPPRRLDVFLQEAVRLLAGVARPRIGPGAAFVVGGAGGLAGVVAVAALEIEALVVAAVAVDRGFDGIVAPFDHAGAAHAGNAAIALQARRQAALEPAHRTVGQVGRIAEGPGTAAA